jgi:hypothetical protein
MSLDITGVQWIEAGIGIATFHQLHLCFQAGRCDGRGLSVLIDSGIADNGPNGVPIAHGVG